MIGQVFVEYFLVYTPCNTKCIQLACFYININRQSIYVMECGTWIVDCGSGLTSFGCRVEYPSHSVVAQATQGGHMINHMHRRRYYN